MLYFVQQKRGDKPHMPLNVVERATFQGLFPVLKRIKPKLLYKMQYSPFLWCKGAENVAFFAGFIAPWSRPGEGVQPDDRGAKFFSVQKVALRFIALAKLNKR
jgi:hypothetical protein